MKNKRSTEIRRTSGVRFLMLTRIRGQVADVDQGSLGSHALRQGLLARPASLAGLLAEGARGETVGVSLAATYRKNEALNINIICKEMTNLK